MNMQNYSTERSVLKRGSTHIHLHPQTLRQKSRHTHTHTGRERGREGGRETERQKQTNRQTDRDRNRDSVREAFLCSEVNKDENRMQLSTVFA